MGSTWSETRAVLGEEFRRATRRTWFRVMTLAVPVVMLVMLIVVPVVRDIASSDDEGAGDAGRIGLIDLSGDPRMEAVAAAADVRVFPDREAGTSALLGEKITSLFVIPRDYVESGRVEWIRAGSAISAGLSGRDDATQVEALLREALVADVLAPEVTHRFVRPAGFESVVVGEGGLTKEGPKEVSPLSVSYVFALLLMTSVLVGSGYLLQSVSDEKENRMIEVLLTSVSPLGLMAGKVLALGSIGLLQMTVWAVSIVFMGPRILEVFPNLGELAIDPVLLVWLFAFFLAGYVVFGVTNAGIGAATTSYREASQISMLLLVPGAVVPLWMFMLIAGAPDGPLARVLSLIPITAPITMMLRIGATDIGVAEILASLAVTILGGLLLLWGSARVFRAGLLMYGQRMDLRRVFAVLRQAG